MIARRIAAVCAGIVLVGLFAVKHVDAATPQSDCARVSEHYSRIYPLLSEMHDRLLAAGNDSGASALQAQMDAWNVRFCDACVGAC